ncbi:Phosphatidylserine decarboxylase proenzyme 3 [Trametes pubescens]|uniref:Phosphatidylserine decarboxylase proenzyme 3 n=1 Tax=Trametes pubescens TaxID=154538 RepID=A0A1M2VWS2_TRAPU|nr:Phosphatidylserine decarboxylase proenzyme 3 [Trametes pubescens]
MSSDVVQKLRDYLDKDPVFKAEFEQALETAKSYDIPEFEEWGIVTLADYLNYYESFLKWVPSENKDGTFVLYHICMFYFVLDMLPLVLRQSPIDPSTRSPYTWLSEWIIEYAKEMGKWMDSTDSISDATIESFYQAESYHMQDYDRIPGEWTTFNKFFARHIKPKCRPIDCPGEDKVIVSPADATFDGAWPVDGSANCQFEAKGIPWSIEQLLDDEHGTTKYGAKFAGGTFCHSFLGPNDYHRQHAPVSGTVLEARVIEGLCYLEVEVVEDDPDAPKRGGRPRLGMRRKMQPRAAEPRDSLNAPDNPGYQFIQARGLILIDNPELGLVAVLPIGMAQVSSVMLGVKPRDEVKKGDEISYFQLGGSDIVMVFQAGANVKFTAKEQTHYAFGKTLAIASSSGSGSG